MKKIFCVFLVLCFSCEDENRPTTGATAPPNLIPTEKMIPIIVDLQILESHFQRTFNRPDLYKASLDSSSSLIFEKYAVSKSQFDSSYTYYAYDTETMFKIYESALDSLNFGIVEMEPN